MNIINNCIAILILFMLPKFCLSQDYKYTIFYNSESFSIVNQYLNPSPLSQYGLGFQRIISDKFLVRISTSQWANRIYVEEKGTNKIDTALSYSPFHLTGRSVYGFIDATFGYILLKEKNEISIIGGVTYADGYNEYTKIYWNSSWYNGQFYIHDGVGYSKLIKFTSWGINSKLYYNRYFHHNRFNIGIQAGFRYLFEYPKPQIELGLHVGYNFNLFRKRSK